MEIRKIGPYIKEIDIRNNEGKETNLLGVSVNKNFMPSIANTIGTDWTKYKIIKKNQFCYIPDTSRRGDKIGIALLKEYDEALVSQAYTVFSVDKSTILPEYLMLWFRRNEFDRYARFHSHGSVREIFDWHKLSNVELPLPSIEEQQKIVEEYNSITERIAVKEAINNNLFEQMKSFFKIHIINNIIDKVNDGIWSIEKLTNICNVVYGKGLPTTNLIDYGYPVYGGNGIIGFYNKYLYDEHKVLISCRGVASGNVLYSIPYSFVTSNSLVLNIIDNRITFEYLYLLLLNIDFKSKITGSAQPQLTVENIKDVEIVVVDCVTLSNISRIIYSYIKQMDINKEEINSLIRIRDLLLNNLSMQQ